MDLGRYRKLRNQVSTKVDDASHFRKVIGDVRKDPRGFYRFMNSSRTDSSSIPSLQYGNILLPSDQEKGNCRNNYLSWVLLMILHSRHSALLHMYLFVFLSSATVVSWSGHWRKRTGLTTCRPDRVTYAELDGGCVGDD